MLMQLWQKCIAMHIHVLGTGKLISKSGFFPCLLLSAERQALGPLVHVCNHVALAIFQACKVTVKDFSTIIINVTPSPWSRPGSSHEDLSMHANTQVLLTFPAGIPTKMVVVI
jgi:hypothetical protein